MEKKPTRVFAEEVLQTLKAQEVSVGLHPTMYSPDQVRKVLLAKIPELLGERA